VRHSDSHTRELDRSLLRYAAFLGCVCVMGGLLMGWEVFFCWLLSYAVLRLFRNLLAGEQQ